jgi:adenylate cyclase
MISPRTLRWGSGLVLLAFVGSHLLNHAAGILSLGTAELLRDGFVAFWRHPLSTVALYGALLTHMALALHALAGRSTLRMPWAEALRLVLGLAMPLLMAAHVVGTRGAHMLFDHPDAYGRVVRQLWAADGGVRQVLLMLVAWWHGCLGLHFALRHREGWRRYYPLLFAAMVMVPLLGLLGFYAMAFETRGVPADPQTVPVLAPAQRETLGRLASGLSWGWAALVVSALVLRGLRTALARHRGALVRLSYPGRAVDVPRGWTVLEASRAYGIPHMSLCGGRARCSTCRVRVDAASAPLEPPAAQEAATLRRIGAAPDVRLACQLRVQSPLAVTPLFVPTEDRRALERPAHQDREIAVLFIDLRRWTGLSERHWPHDLVYVLDRYFHVVGEAVRDSGGVPNQFIGDSVMALFMHDEGLPKACAEALRSAAEIERRLQSLNASMEQDFGHRLEFGMGLHCGYAAVGEVGFRDTRTLTAVGDVVNIASRLQEMTKLHHARLVVSQEVLTAAGVRLPGVQSQAVSIRGRSAMLSVFALQELASMAQGCAQTH